MNGSQITIGRSLQEHGQIVVPNHNGDLVAIWPYGVGDTPHALIVGATGSGKTTLVRWMVIDLIWSPGSKRVTLIDGKGADSFAMFMDRRHVVGIFNRPDPTSTEKDPIPDVVRAFHKEVRRRYTEFSIAKRWAMMTESRINYNRPEPMWLILDEYMEWILGLGKQLQVQMLKALISIAQKAREANAHLIIATQAPYAETVGETGLPGPLKRQLKCRIAVAGTQGLDDIEAKMAFGPGFGNAGDWINRAAANAGLKGKQRRGIGMVRVGFQQAYFKCPWVADPYHWETSEPDRIAALKMLPPKLKLVKTDEEESA
jgi:hypothetical protein